MPTRPDSSAAPRDAWRRTADSGGAPEAAFGGDVLFKLQKADRLRDAGRCAEAAAAYGDVLARAPDRVDIRVQLGNMLKDAGRPRDAVDAYRHALATQPEDADIHLQLGHALKLLGDRAGAVAAYREASRLGAAGDADRELAALGEVAEQNRTFAARPWDEALRGIAELGTALDDLRGRLDHVSAALPALGSLVAVPVESYERYRSAFAVPAPPRPTARPVTVLCLADEVEPETLALQLGSLRDQHHGAWRLLVLGSRAGQGRGAVDRQAHEDGRIAWVAVDEAPAAAELRVAVEQDGLVLLLAPGARLDPAALGWFAAAFDLAEAEAFVCDEEVAAEVDGRPVRRDPTLRQVVDPDALAERNAFGETVAVAAAALRARRSAVLTTSVSAARSSLLLALAEEGAVGHIPFPLVHRAAASGPRPDVHAAAVAAHRARTAPRRAAPQAPAARIAVIVPTRDNAGDVDLLVASLRGTADRADLLDVTVLDDGGTDPGSCAVLDRLAARGEIGRIAVDAPFNWSALNNRGAAASDAPLLVFANDDMRMLTGGWDGLLRALLARPEVGAVGAKLLYPDGTLQHAGILFGWTPTPTHHDGLHRAGDDPGPAGRWAVTRAVSAVTGAFLATRRDTFEAVGGFDAAALPVGYGDVDYALKLRALGHRILWTPHIALHHHESKTRGLDRLDPAKAARAEAEDRLMRLRWAGVLDRDPGVHPAWRPESLPFRLLDPWSAARAAGHIALTGRRRPWLVPAPSGSADHRSRDIR